MAGPQAGNESLLRSFARSLRARNRSPKTISSYLEAARLLSEHAHNRDLLVLNHSDIEEFLAHQLEHHRPTTAAVRFRSLQQFYRWAVTEELIETTPMVGLSPPAIPERPVAVLDEAQLARLLGCMNSRSFDDRRDTAIVRLFLDTGMRLSEMAGLALSDIDLDADVPLFSARAVDLVLVRSVTRLAKPSSVTSESAPSIVLPPVASSGLVVEAI